MARGPESAFCKSFAGPPQFGVRTNLAGKNHGLNAQAIAFCPVKSMAHVICQGEPGPEPMHFVAVAHVACQAEPDPVPGHIVAVRTDPMASPGVSHA